MRGKVVRTTFLVLTVVLMGNLGSLIDLILHPKIPYFDGEHLIVGGITAAATAILLTVVAIYTDRIRIMNERLRKAAAEWNDTFDAIDDCISVHDNEMRIIKVNKAVGRLLNTSDNLIGKKCYEAFHGPDGPPEICPMAKPAAERDLDVAEFFEPNLNCWLSVSCFPIIGETGDIAGSVHIAKDITDRKEAERNMVRERDFSRALVETMPGLFYLIDQSGRLVKWNRNFEEVTGYPAEEIPGRAPLDFIAADGRGLVAQKIRDVFVAGKAAAEAEILSKSAGKLPYLLTGVRIVMDGRPYLLGVGLDIAERKRAEDEIRRLNDELELKVEERTTQLVEAQEELVRKEKLAILGQLAGSVGHELRNPLGVINNAVYFLKTVTSDDDDVVKDYLDIIKGEVDNAERIIADLLDFSRTKTPQTVPVHLPELVRLSLEKCVIPDTVRVVTEIPETLPQVMTDPFQMGQVFRNLIVNAVQAMPEGGDLHISSRPVYNAGKARHGFSITGTCMPEGDFIEVAVADTGEGITPGNMKKLFQPLFTTKTNGIGLGLVVSMKIAETNGGTIEVASVPGKGTTFRVLLPVCVHEVRDKTKVPATGGTGEESCRK